MTIKQLIDKLQQLKQAHGDLEVVTFDGFRGEDIEIIDVKPAHPLMEVEKKGVSWSGEPFTYTDLQPNTKVKPVAIRIC